LATIPTGRFMQPALGAGEPMAHVVGGEGLPKMIPENEYRAAGIQPPFETLPTLDEFERAQEANGADTPGEQEGSAPKSISDEAALPEIPEIDDEPYDGSPL
jgi:hypothetical protein